MARIVRITDLRSNIGCRGEALSHGERVCVRGAELAIVQQPSPGADAPPSPHGRGISDSTPSVFTEIDAIFFGSASTQDFASPEARADFRDLWLGRYLQHFPDWCFVALDDGGAAAGYLAGSPVSNHPPLPGPDYFSAFPPELIDAFPAHMHVNVRADSRGQRIGEALVYAFRQRCADGGLPGFHAVTAADGAAAAFFSRCGLAERARVDWRDRRLAFLGVSIG
jgi:GNAT superfamily N-acetyltransferase